MIDLIYNKKQKKITLPESWNELTTPQYIRLSQLIHAGIDDIDIAADKALHILSGFSLFGFLRIPLEMRMRCYSYVTWVFEQRQITKQLLPVYKKFYAPASEFSNMRLKEFHHAEMIFYQLVHEPDEAALNELVAVLYRPAKENYDIKKNSDGDIRIDYNYNEVAFYKRKISRWHLHVKQAVALWYAGCREQLREDYPLAFEGNDNTTVNYYDGLFGLIRSLSGERYGTFEKVEDIYVPNAFKEVEECKREEIELKNKYPELYK